MSVKEDALFLLMSGTFIGIIIMLIATVTITFIKYPIEFVEGWAIVIGMWFLVEYVFAEQIAEMLFLAIAPGVIETVLSCAPSKKCKRRYRK